MMALVMLAVMPDATSAADLPPVDPPDFWREVGPRHASSTCIGSKASPVCMLDTLMACFLRGGDICYRAITDQKSAQTYAKRTAKPATEFTRYRIAGSKYASADGEDGYAKRKAGDMVLLYDDILCFERSGGEPNCFGSYERPGELTLRQEGQLWRIIAWGWGNRR